MWVNNMAKLFSVLVHAQQDGKNIVIRGESIRPLADVIYDLVRNPDHADAYSEYKAVARKWNGYDMIDAYRTGHEASDKAEFSITRSEAPYDRIDLEHNMTFRCNDEDRFLAITHLEKLETRFEQDEYIERYQIPVTKTA
jgi:hypothetical protein